MFRESLLYLESVGMIRSRADGDDEMGWIGLPQVLFLCTDLRDPKDPSKPFIVCTPSQDEWPSGGIRRTRNNRRMGRMKKGRTRDDILRNGATAGEKFDDVTKSEKSNSAEFGRLIKAEPN